MDTQRHVLKCWPEMFEAVRSGEKRAEFRLNDRDFKAGDVIELREWDQATGEYTMRVEWRFASHVARLDDFGAVGFVLISLAMPNELSKCGDRWLITDEAAP